LRAGFAGIFFAGILANNASGSGRATNRPDRSVRSPPL
jgi:hypothetical protein